MKGGRRVNKEKCYPNPSIHHIAIAVKACGFKFVAEPLCFHPRDYFGLGRLKIEMVNEETGLPVNEAVGTNKRKLFDAIADALPDAKTKYDEELAK